MNLSHSLGIVFNDTQVRIKRSIQINKELKSDMV